MTIKLTGIHLRDPFVVPVKSERRYYLYGTTDENCWGGPGTGFNCFTSADLDNWEGPIVAFNPSPDFWGKENFWAPEVHFYKRKFYMFASFKAAGRCRGTQILVAGEPQGPFVPHSDTPVTPQSWECLDGTLFVDHAGDPWIIFCHEWTQVKDGEMCTLRLSVDLKKSIGDPLILFRASGAPWVSPHLKTNYVTDGPFIYKTKNNALCMLWSSIGPQGYAQGIAHSETGNVQGPWTHEPLPLFSRDGGHGMIFIAFDNRLLLSLHRPNEPPKERPLFIEVYERDGRIILK